MEKRFRPYRLCQPMFVSGKGPDWNIVPGPALHLDGPDLLHLTPGDITCQQGSTVGTLSGFSLPCNSQLAVWSYLWYSPFSVCQNLWNILYI